MSEHKKIPAYQSVYQSLKTAILEGEYAINDLLPPEGELEKIYGVSRITVRRAIEMLTNDGFIRVQQGFGTQVLPYNTTQNMNTISSMSKTLTSKGMRVHPKSMFIDCIEASARIAKELDVKVGAPIVRVQRIQMADDAPIAIIRNYIPAFLVPNIEHYQNQFTGLYEFLSQKYAITIDAVKDRISARSCTFDEAQMLDVPVQTALIYFARACYQKGKIVCVDHCRILGSKYEFEMYTKA